MSVENQKLLFDPMKHPEWIPPQTGPWYSSLASETGGYKYPWKSQFEEPTAEMIFATKISSYLTDDSRILDVGCGHGDFTYKFAHNAKEVVGIDAIEGFISTANKSHIADSTRFLVVDTDFKLPFPDNRFDVVYTKKGPWLYHKGMEEGLMTILII